MTTLPDKPNLRPKEIAEFLSIRVSTVYRMIDEEYLPSLRLNNNTIHGALRIPRDLFLNWYKKRLSNGENDVSE